ncbi:ABC transporter ATP-binding protein [Paenimyroides tangerinum]|uniref:ABC transporter ATP-binding protein n=1 Tax=Paenimyroides tangerinum TaxID=2488728 RepID=A0A3P3W4J2_9FLAO|nr:ABC transporter ATP-binding protein [Paenimyroides tangerinum]RRJ89347.1 ABC transporter ATP-binding protein [Paenimyroides tangerinum]
MNEYLIQTKDLNFQFNNKRKILENLSLNIPKGSIYGFLGPNGAGKSTTMRLITGLLNEQQNESIYLFGETLSKQLPQIFKRIGSIIETPTLYLHLSGYDNLKLIATIQEVPNSKIQEILELVELSKFQKQKAKQYSLGMKQRLAIGMALLNDPELLILDEPVNGLDPQGIIEVRQLLKKLNKEKGITIFISSHLLSEIEKTCTHVGIINQGKLLFEGSLGDLGNKNKNITVDIILDEVEKYHSKLNGFEVTQIDSKTLQFVLDNEKEIPELIQNLVQNDFQIYGVNKRGGLEDWFINLTDKK